MTQNGQFIKDIREIDRFLDELVAAGRAGTLRKFISQATEVDVTAAERFIKNSEPSGLTFTNDTELADVYNGILGIESQADDVINILASLKTIELSDITQATGILPVKRLRYFIEAKERINNIILDAVRHWHRVLHVIAGAELAPQSLAITTILFFLDNDLLDNYADLNDALITRLSRLVFPPQEQNSDLYTFCAFETSHHVRLQALNNIIKQRQHHNAAALIRSFQALPEDKKNSLNDTINIPAYMEQL